MRAIKHIVVHCTATKEHQEVTAADIDRWHKQRGWSGIGYHYVVKLNGHVEKGRSDSQIGAHVKGHNAHSIGVVYVGGLDKNGKSKDTRTDAQKKTLRGLLDMLKGDFPKAEILGHRDLSPDLNGNGIIEPHEYLKDCPCFDAKKEYKDV